MKKTLAIVGLVVVVAFGWYCVYITFHPFGKYEAHPDAPPLNLLMLPVLGFIAFRFIKTLRGK